jgi:hypothetical protein
MLATIGHNSGARVRCIFRSHGERGYTKLRNSFLQDRRISDETRGLVARLLSLPDDWEVTVQSIIASGKAGRDKVYRMLKEAEEFGYIKPERERRTAGTFERQLYLVSDDPQSLIERAAQELYEIEAENGPLTANPEVAETAGNNPLPGNPEVVNQPLTAKPDVVKTEVEEKPLTAKPDTANPQRTNKDIYKITLDNNPPIVPPSDEPKPRKARSVVPDEYPQDFEEFWKVYPRREGKLAAYKSWQRLKLPQKRRAYMAMKSQLSVLSAKARDHRGNFCPLPATWINQGRFDDDPQPPTPASNAPSRPTFTQYTGRKKTVDEMSAEEYRAHVEKGFC